MIQLPLLNSTQKHILSSLLEIDPSPLPHDLRILRPPLLRLTELTQHREKVRLNFGLLLSLFLIAPDFRFGIFLDSWDSIVAELLAARLELPPLPRRVNLLPY